ncbi:MAG: hypothetical protein DRN20_05265 [Thermoplasmata archaeon]|nr:MAG: hypothetical protein DRN20_05265 [Thermoplasmata archaeon]
MSDIEVRIVECLRPLLGDMAPVAVDMQKKKLGIGTLATAEDYKKLAIELKNMCEEMAGEVIANKIYKMISEVIEEYS